MVATDLRVSGTYLLCNGNRIHKFRIKWCSKSTPTVEQVHEVMRVTEDIVKSNNLPRRIKTRQLKIVTKISFWTPRSKALSMRQFKYETQGHLSAHKHAYVLMVFLADSKEQQDCEDLPASPIVHNEDGCKNESQSHNVEKEVVTVSNNTEFIQMDGMQLHTKAADEDKSMSQNQVHTKEPTEVLLDKCEGEQQFFITRIEKLEKVIERACMDAKVCQTQAKIVGHGNEHCASEVATDSMRIEIVDCSGTTGCTVELNHDLEAKPKETINSINTWKNYSFPITDAEAVCQDETIIKDDKCVEHSSSTKKLDVSPLQVVTTHWKFGNTKSSTNRNLEMFDTSKAALYKQCTACHVQIAKLPFDCKKENVAKLQACEIPLTISAYSTLTHSNKKVTQNYKLSDNMNMHCKTTDVVIRRKRRHGRNESNICEIPKKRQMITDGISPVILGPTSFEQFSPCHTGVMSEYSALKTFENILVRSGRRNGTVSSFLNCRGRLEKWLMYRSNISRLRAVSRVNNDTELREILRYMIRNLRNRSANLSHAQQNKLVYFTHALWMCDVHSDRHTKREPIMRSEETKTIMQDLSKESWYQNAIGKIGSGCYKNSSALQMKSDSPVCSSENREMSCESSLGQEPRAFNTILSIKQEHTEENNLLQAALHKSKICESAVEDICENSKDQNIKVGSVATENNQPLEAESTEKFKCATSKNLPKDKDTLEVESNGVVHVLHFGNFPQCSSLEYDDDHLGKAKRPVQAHYDEICIPNVSYYRSPHFSATNSVKRKENISYGSDPVLFKRGNALDNTGGSIKHLQVNGVLKMAEHSLPKPTTSSSADVSSKEILLTAASNLASLEGLCEISSIRTLRKTLIQQGVLEAIEQTKLSSSMYPKCSFSTCSQDFSGENLNSALNNTHEVPSELKSRTDSSKSANCNILERFQDGFDANVSFASNTAEFSSETYTSVSEDLATNGCNNKNCSQNSRPQIFPRKTSYKKVVPPDRIISPSPSRTAVATKPVRVKVGKLLSCSKAQVIFTTEFLVNADCPPTFSDCDLHNMLPKSQTSSNVQGDLITAFLHSMAFKASQTACSAFDNQSNMAHQSSRLRIPERNKSHATSPSECVVNSNKISLPHEDNFLKCTCLPLEMKESILPTCSHCKCPPSVKFQGISASCTVMGSETKIKIPRRQLIDVIHNIKSNVKDRRNSCNGKHCFYFHVDNEESVEGFYSTVEKYCSALSKFQSHQYSSSRSIEILLRDIWLPGHKHSISFYVNLPLQKCKCHYCGLDTTVELCLNCGELFERTELGNYVPFDSQKMTELVNMKIEIDKAAVEVLNLVNDIYLCKPVVVIQPTDTSMSKQNKTCRRHRKKTQHRCCKV